MRKISEILYRAGDVLRMRGHAKNYLEDSAGGVCLNGAVNVAAHGTPQWELGQFDAEAPIRDAASVAIGTNYEAVDWNNAPERTPEEVQIALDAAYVVQLQEEGIEPEDVLR